MLCSHPHSSLLFIHHSIKEEDQSDACWGEGLHPAFQDTHVLLPLTPTQPVLTRVPAAQTGHAVHNKCGTWKKGSLGEIKKINIIYKSNTYNYFFVLSASLFFFCSYRKVWNVVCVSLFFYQTYVFFVRLLNIFLRVSSLIMMIASMLLFSCTINTFTDWPTLVNSQEASCHMIRSTLITETQSVSEHDFHSRNLTPEWDSAVRCESWRPAISFRSTGTHAWGQQRSTNPWRPFTPISAKKGTQW